MKRVIGSQRGEETQTGQQHLSVVPCRTAASRPDAAFMNPSTLSDIIHYVHMLKEHKSLQLLKLSHITLIECLLIKCIHDWTN